jgi:Uma2 family endonuclease
MAIRDTARRKLTYEDYLLFPDDGNRHEILDGEHHVTAAPFPKHQRVLRELLFGLHSFLREHRLGEVYSAPLDVVLSRHDVVQPDLLFISNERMTILTERNLQGAPDLAIEILSSTTRRIDEGHQARALRALRRAGVLAGGSVPGGSADLSPGR